MATITEVAKAAGVSTATVSRVVHGDASVKDSTRKLVEETIHAMNYKPNLLARQMRKQETKTVIVIVPNIGNTFFSEILSGIEVAAKKNDYQVLIADMHNEPGVEKYYFNAIQQRQVDGIISLSANVAKSLLEQVAGEYPIVVACQYLEGINVPNVTIDNIGAARAIVEHLIQLGHQHIAHLTGAPSFLLYRDRFNGYISALAAHGLPIDLELVRYGDSSVQSGYEQTQELLNMKKPVTAIFASGDIMAIGAMKALKEAGLRVPEDCAVVGFDDIEISAVWEPALTTIRQPKFQIGETAFLKLLKLMKKQPLKQAKEILDYELIVRDSCGYKLKSKEASAQ